MHETHGKNGGFERSRWRFLPFVILGPRPKDPFHDGPFPPGLRLGRNWLLGERSHEVCPDSHEVCPSHAEQSRPAEFPPTRGLRPLLGSAIVVRSNSAGLAAEFWINDLARGLGWRDRDRAYTALLATLHGVRDCFAGYEAVYLGARLPLLLPDLYYEG